ncbi:MAG: ATP-binding protein [Muribaculaceae bacterium]|nr:ATP-binding protein [Muribaculaceae bacterium]
MNREVLKSIIKEGQEVLEDVTLVTRLFDMESNGRYVFVGIRQCGKSYLMYQQAKKLLLEGHNLKEMLFVNFDDERLQGFKSEDLGEILKAYEDLYEGKPILFLDEIQNIDGWEHFARRMANLKYRIYITGSNAKMLSRDIATRLGGRYMSLRVFPYSFREYLHANNVEITSDWEFGKKRGEIERYLKEYFQWGGFPELMMYVNKRHWLNELYEKIILADIIQRNSIRNEQALRLAIRRMAENIKTPTSYTRISNMLKAAGVSTNTASISDYMGFCRDACLLFEMENYASKFAEKATVKKHYFIDNGLLNIFLYDSDTALLENMVATTLYRGSFRPGGEKIYFYNKEMEIDFYLPESKRAIQASFALSSQESIDREAGALLKFHRLYGLREAQIVTYSHSETLIYEDLTINVIPLSRWLLSEL